MTDNRVKNLLALPPTPGRMAEVLDIMEKRGNDIQAGLDALNLNYKSFPAWVWDGLTGKGWDAKYNN